MTAHNRGCFVIILLLALLKSIQIGGGRAQSTDEFFDDSDPFFTSLTQIPKSSFEASFNDFFDAQQEESFFKKEKDIFEKIKADEEYFFRAEDERKKARNVVTIDENKHVNMVSQGSRYCNCEGLFCGCCSFLKFRGKEKFRGCFEMEYVPNDFAIFMTLSINNHTVVTRVISGRNPLPFCAKSRYVPLVSFCIRLYDVHHNPQGVSLCLRLEVTSMRQILFSISFDCIKIENHKISFLVPPNATTFGVFGLHLGDTDPYLSYQDWTKLHFPLPEVPSSPSPTTVPNRKHHFLWFK